MTRHQQIIAFLDELRDSFPNCVEVYTQGSCFRLFRILKTIWPEAECWYDYNHAITRIDNRFYDIRGEVLRGNHIPLEKGDEARMFTLRYSG